MIEVRKESGPLRLFKIKPSIGSKNRDVTENLEPGLLIHDIEESLAVDIAL